MLVLAFAATVADGLLGRPHAAVAQAAAVTRLPGLAVSVSYLEPRVRMLSGDSEVLHPGLRPVSRLDWVHAR